MSGLLLCGRQAEVPLYIESEDIRIYTLEELCYYLYHNLFMVEREFFGDDLLVFLGEQLNLKSLAGKVKYLIDHRGTFPELVTVIVQSAGYFHEQELEEIQETLRLIGTKSVIERLKVRADIFMKNEKHGQALRLYTEILTMPREKNVNNSFYGKVYHNLGIIYSGKLQYSEALAHFRKAYELYPVEDVLQSIITADMLSEKEKELMNDIVRYQVNNDLLDRVEELLKHKREQVLASEEYKKLCDVLTYDGRHNLDDYYDEISQTVDAWKQEYREEMV